jgi:site-specific DNA-methyltransferase (adenine-specific)
MELYNNDCFLQMSNLEDACVDLVFCDLPYGETSCKWDSKIDLEAFWVEINRITKPTTPIFFTTTTKYGAELIASNPKNFRYDLVWVKSASCGFLNAKKMPMRKHELIYVFYKRLPYYNLSSHIHKFKLDYKKIPKEEQELKVYGKVYGEDSYNSEYIGKAREANVYDPPLPNSIVKLEDLCIYDVNANCYGGGKEGRIKITKNKEDHSIKYEPPLPNSVLEIQSQKGKHSTQKPIELMKWILKYYSKENDVVLDPTMGSGSMGVACKLMNRKFIGIEKNKDIYKYAVKRIEETTIPTESVQPHSITDIAGNIIQSSSSSLVSINEEVSPNTHIG